MADALRLCYFDFYHACHTISTKQTISVNFNVMVLDKQMNLAVGTIHMNKLTRAYKNHEYKVNP